VFLGDSQTAKSPEDESTSASVVVVVYFQKILNNFSFLFNLFVLYEWTKRELKS
jgi:hypothetical protein